MKDFSREMIYFVFVSQTLDKKNSAPFSEKQCISRSFAQFYLMFLLSAVCSKVRRFIYLLLSLRPRTVHSINAPRFMQFTFYIFVKPFLLIELNTFFSQLVAMNPTLPKILLKSTFSMWQPPPNICLKGHGIFMSIRRKTLNIIPINYS